MQVQATQTGVPADKFRILAASAVRKIVILLAVLQCAGTTWLVSMKSTPDSGFRTCNRCVDVGFANFRLGVNGVKCPPVTVCIDGFPGQMARCGVTH